MMRDWLNILLGLILFSPLIWLVWALGCSKGRRDYHESQMGRWDECIKIFELEAKTIKEKQEELTNG